MGISIGLVSNYMVVKKWSILGDIISHAALPGIVVTFFLTHSTSLPVLLCGGLLSSLISVLSSFYLQKYELFPRDTSFALLLSLFFSFGIICFNIIQRKGIPGQSLLNSFIFGNILMIDYQDMWYYIFYALILFLFFIFTRKKQQFFAFDPVYSSIHCSYFFLWEIIFLIISIITIVIALQSVGILLVGGLIILPGSAAYLIAKTYGHMMFFAIFFSVLIFLIGINLTFAIPILPTGPISILVGSTIFFSVFFIKKCFLNTGA
jgi:manganese/zinc/iron transport system permease protein